MFDGLPPQFDHGFSVYSTFLSTQSLREFSDRLAYIILLSPRYRPKIMDG